MFRRAGLQSYSGPQSPVGEGNGLLRQGLSRWVRKLFGPGRRHSRVWRWAASTALGLALAGSPVTRANAAAAHATGTQPNIVLVMVDDLDVGSMNTLLQAGLMPNLQTHLTARGVTFNQCFGTTPVCTPSRATLLTGQYAHNHSVARNEFPGGGVTMFRDNSTLATWLSAAGYRTGFVGKYLSGYGNSDINHDGVFDARDASYIPPGWNEWFGLLTPYENRMYQFVANDNGKVTAYGTDANSYQTDVLSGKAVSFLDKFKAASPTSPFFLAVLPGAPHQEVYPNLPTSAYSDAWKWTIRPAPRHTGSVTLPLPMPLNFNEADMTDKPAWMQLRPLLTSADVTNLTQQYQDRLASMRAVDDLIGSLVAKLTSLNAMDRTVLIFTSDNGFLMGQHRLPQKLVAHEESIRLPLIVAASWLPQAQASQIILDNDLAPTIADLAGATPTISVDGTSFASLLPAAGRTARWRRRFIVERWPGAKSLFELPSYYALRTAPDAPDAPNETLIRYSDGSEEFYDLTTDPAELTSLHLDPSPPRVYQRFVNGSWLNQMLGCSGKACRDREFHPAN